MERILRIDPRFNGPPASGNGGYVCGEIARSIPGAARVRLHSPPPLDTDLRLTAIEGDGVGLFHGETAIAAGWPTRLEIEPPAPPGLEEATAASKAFRGFQHHPLPTCFVCGPDREEGDGMRLFPGPLAPGERMAGQRAGEGVFAAPWTPHPSLARSARPGAADRWEAARAPSAAAEDEIDPVFIWSALDCPGCFSFPQPEGALVLLGELSARIDGPVRIGRPHVVVSWSIEHSGRKHVTGTALFDAERRCRGVARAIWIEVAQDAQAGSGA